VISGILTLRKRLSNGTQIAKATAFAIRPPVSDPLHGSDERSEQDPHGDGGEAADASALTLRQHDIGQTQEDRRGVDRQTCQCALGNKRGIVIERKEDVRGAGRNRQCRDQRADHRPGALGDDRCRDHERGGDRHAQRKRQEQGEFGRHF